MMKTSRSRISRLRRLMEEDRFALRVERAIWSMARRGWPAFEALLDAADPTWRGRRMRSKAYWVRRWKRDRDQMAESGVER